MKNTAKFIFISLSNNLRLFKLFAGCLLKYAALQMLLVVALFGQIIKDEEVIKISTKLAQININIEQEEKPEPFKIEVNDNGLIREDVFCVTPKDAPLQVVIIAAMDPTVEKEKINKSELLRQLKELKNNPRISLLAINVVVDSENKVEILNLERVSKTIKFNILKDAVASSIDSLRKSSGMRKSLLILTNNVESLPPDIIERTDRALRLTSAMIFLMSVNEKIELNPKTKMPRKTIARTNINGGLVSLSRDDYLSGLFRVFNGLAKNLYTVSFYLNEENADLHTIEAIVKRKKDNQEIAKNARQIKIDQTADEANSAKIGVRQK